MYSHAKKKHDKTVITGYIHIPMRTCNRQLIVTQRRLSSLYHHRNTTLFCMTHNTIIIIFWSGNVVLLTVVDTRLTFSRRRLRSGRDDGFTRVVAHRILCVNVYVTGIHNIMTVFVCQNVSISRRFSRWWTCRHVPAEPRHGNINEDRSFSSTVVVILRHDFYDNTTLYR